MRRWNCFDFLTFILLAGGVSTSPSCKSPGPDDVQVPAQIVVTPSSIAFDALQATQQLNAIVLDRSGVPIASALVTWASRNSSIVTVNNTGLVTAIGTGNTEITATAAQASTEAPAVVEQIPTQLGKQGDLQSGTVGKQLASPLVIQVNDALGSPIPQVEVAFAVLDGGGSLANLAGKSGGDGRVQTLWTLGAIATADGGQHQVRATVVTKPNVTASFMATATADVATRIVKSGGDGQSGSACRPLGLPIETRVVDQYNNGVRGTGVAFVVGLGGGTLNPTSTISDTQGFAATKWTLGPPGDQTLQASAAGLTGSPLTFGATSLPPPSDTTVTRC